MFAPKLCLLWVTFIVCIGAAEYGLWSAGLRYDGSIKDAVVWAVLAGLPIYVKFDNASKDPSLLTRALLDALRVTALVEFFVNLYVFPLWVELPMQLLLILIGLLATVANMQETTPREVRGCLNSLSALGGLAIVVVVAVHLGRHWSAIDWRQTALSFAQPLALTVAAVVATWLVAIVAAYEVTLGFALAYPLGEQEPRGIHRLALVAGLGIRLRKIAAFRGAVSVRLRRTTSFRAALAVVHAYRQGRISPDDWPDALDGTD
jgi:hypothetical protein